MALRLAREGAHVWLVDRNEDQLACVVEEVRGLGVEAVGARCDVSRPEEITACNQALLAQWGHVDILVNNAGVVYYGPTLSMTPQQWSYLLAVNLQAPIQFTCELLPTLRERPEAHIVNVASIFGFVVTNRTLAYHVSKFGLIGFTEGLRAEFASRGIGATAVCPGFVTTNLFASGQCGYAGRTAPIPPRWVSTTPDNVAAKTIRGIYLNRRLVLVTPLAYLLYYAKRFAPGLLDGLYRVRRRAKGKAETAPVVTPHPAMLRG